MKKIFKKAITIAGTALMLGSTIGMAAAAAYPAPFVESGAASVAVVVGANAALSDAVAATAIGSNLATKLAAQTATSGTTAPSVSGEAAALFTSSTKLYTNQSLNVVKSVLTKTELPTVLADGSFSGNVDATYTQTIEIGSNPVVTFAKQPTSSDDPAFGLTLSTTTTNVLYNATVTFNKAVAMNHSDSEGEQITLLGQTFTIASATDGTDLVLLKSAEKLTLDSNDPSSDVTIGGATYTIELVSASDTSATIKVTDSTGASETKEINEAASKKIKGLTIAVDTADENNIKYSATITAGAEKITLTDGSSVTSGDDATVLDGTKVKLTGGTSALTKIIVSVAAPNGDNDAILAGSAFTDPLFGTFKVDFSSLNIADDDTSAREDIVIGVSGDDKLELTMTTHAGDSKTVQWAINAASSASLTRLQADADGRNITVFEGQPVYRSEYVVVGNEDDGMLLKVTTITNQTTSYTSDKVVITDVFSGDAYTATITSEGHGTITIGGKVYTLSYYGSNSVDEDARYIRLDYPDSVTTATDAVIYPTIQTSKGAKVAFYEPTTINLGNWDGESRNRGLTTLRFPDGDGYTDVTFSVASGGQNVSINAGSTNLTTAVSAIQSIGPLRYNITYSAANTTVIYLLDPATTGANLNTTALVIWEEKDDGTYYNAMVVTPEGAGTSTDGIGINDVVRTWSNDSVWDAISLASDSKKTKDADKYGSIITIDSADSDQKTATISYPDEQIYANIYIAEESAVITGGTTTTGTATELGSVTVYDNEVSSVAGKNLIVIGGSCINSVASELLGGAKCGDSFTTASGVGAGEALIKSFDRSGKVALLVAGYNAADTIKAATYLTNVGVDTTVGTAMKVTSATEATAITSSA